MALIHRSCNIFLADRIIRSEQTVESFSRALRYDPSDASLWWQRARLHHYSIQNIDISQAIKDYKHALELNPRLGFAWMDLSDAFEQTGEFIQAEEAIEKAFSVQPYSPLIRWKAGNFFLRRGNLPRMYECFEITCRYDSTKLGIAIETAWKIEPSREEILRKLIPDDFQSNLRYLRFLVGKEEYDLAAAAWQRCLENTIPPDYDFQPAVMFGYIDRLLTNNRVPEALQVWKDTLRKALTGLSDPREENSSPDDKDAEPNARNLVWNGSFEQKPLRGGFDWRYPDIDEIKFQIDTATRLKELKSMRISFEGFNVSKVDLYQIVPVFSPGDYILEFYVKTGELTSDQMPYFVITGYPDAKGASARSKNFESDKEWNKVTVPFTVQPGCKAVRVMLCRDESKKLLKNSLIKGPLWLDGITIYR